jgi:hypothetical protein
MSDIDMDEVRRNAEKAIAEGERLRVLLDGSEFEVFGGRSEFHKGEMHHEYRVRVKS